MLKLCIRITATRRRWRCWRCTSSISKRRAILYVLSSCLLPFLFVSATLQITSWTRVSVSPHNIFFFFGHCTIAMCAATRWPCKIRATKESERQKNVSFFLFEFLLKRTHRTPYSVRWNVTIKSQVAVSRKVQSFVFIVAVGVAFAAAAAAAFCWCHRHGTIRLRCPV